MMTKAHNILSKVNNMNSFMHKSEMTTEKQAWTNLLTYGKKLQLQDKDAYIRKSERSLVCAYTPAPMT